MCVKTRQDFSFHSSGVIHLALLEQGLSLQSVALAGCGMDLIDLSVSAFSVLGLQEHCATLSFYMVMGIKVIAQVHMPCAASTLLTEPFPQVPCLLLSTIQE